MLHAAIRLALAGVSLTAVSLAATALAAPAAPNLKSLQLPMTTLTPAATITLGGSPDWTVVTPEAVWVSNDKLRSVQRIDPRTNTVVATIPMRTAPCSGIAAGFGSIWVPLDGQPGGLARIDQESNRITRILPFHPGNDEGGIAVSLDSVWMITDIRGTLLRIDPDSNVVTQTISLPPGSFNLLYNDGIVWVTGFESNVLIAVEAHSGEILDTIPVGPHPRFLTAGHGSIWTLNQGDGSITRVKMSSRRVLATIPAGLPGHGGDICAGAGFIWATLSGVPLTKIDPTTNQIVRQWVGDGGDELRFGLDSLWLTNLKAGLLWRIPAKAGPANQP